MAQSVSKQPSYEERSKAFAEFHQSLLLEAREHLSKSVLKAAQKVTELIDADGTTKADVLRIQLDSAKETLKCNGLVVDKIEMSGQPVVLRITPAHAQKVAKAAGKAVRG